MRKVTSHSERNSIILASSLGRMFWVALECWLKVWHLCCCGHSNRTSGVFVCKKEPAHFGDPLARLFHIDSDLGQGPWDQATWIGNAIDQMSALVLLLGALLPLGGIAWLLLRCFYCVACGSWRLGVLTG